MLLEVGDLAPGFDLVDQTSTTVRLWDYRGKRSVVLVFYPFSFTAVCQGELSELTEDLDTFDAAGVQLLAVSCDSSFAQAHCAQELGIPFPLLSDFWPHGQVAKAYGAFNEALGCANRTTFLIDRQGQVADKFSSADLGTPRSRLDYEKALLRLAEAG